MKKITLVNILAAQIRAAAPGTNRSQSMKKAWAVILLRPGVGIMTFNKKSGERTTRVVSEFWYEFQPPTGGRRTISDDQVLFADLCKVALGSPCIISTFPQNIVSLALA